MLAPAAEATGVRIAPDALRIFKMMGLEGEERKTAVNTLRGYAAQFDDDEIATQLAALAVLQVADDLGGGADVDLRDVAASLEAVASGAEGAAEAPRQLVDHAAWRAAQLLILLFGLAVAYRWITTRALPPRAS